MPHTLPEVLAAIASRDTALATNPRPDTEPRRQILARIRQELTRDR